MIWILDTSKNSDSPQPFPALGQQNRPLPHRAALLNTSISTMFCRVKSPHQGHGGRSIRSPYLANHTGSGIFLGDKQLLPDPASLQAPVQMSAPPGEVRGFQTFMTAAQHHSARNHREEHQHGQKAGPAHFHCPPVHVLWRRCHRSALLLSAAPDSSFTSTVIHDPSGAVCRLDDVLCMPTHVSEIKKKIVNNVINCCKGKVSSSAQTFCRRRKLKSVPM